MHFFLQAKILHMKLHHILAFLLNRKSLTLPVQSRNLSVCFLPLSWHLWLRVGNLWPIWLTRHLSDEEGGVCVRTVGGMVVFHNAWLSGSEKLHCSVGPVIHDIIRQRRQLSGGLAESTARSTSEKNRRASQRRVFWVLRAAGWMEPERVARFFTCITGKVLRAYQQFNHSTHPYIEYGGY